MAWERRKRGGLYYTRTQRVGGRTIREYFGAGHAARKAFNEDLARRETQERQRAAWRGELEQLAATDDTVSTFNAAADEVLRAVLYAAGYHLHKRGEWRQRRG